MQSLFFTYCFRRKAVHRPRGGKTDKIHTDTCNKLSALRAENHSYIFHNVENVIKRKHSKETDDSGLQSSSSSHCRSDMTQGKYRRITDDTLTL